MSPDVTTVVISRNRRDDLQRTLARHQPPVVLVDNASTDGTPEMVRSLYPAVDLLPLATNLGAQARNTGVQHATTPYVAFADDDSWWAPGALEQAADLFHDHPGIGLLAARILLWADEIEDPLCDVMANSPLPHDTLPGRPVLGFAACASIVRREAFLQAGGFDPVIFFGGEEARLALDLATAGWSLRYLPDLRVHHHPSTNRTTTTRSRLVSRNAILTAVMRRPWPAVRHELARTHGLLPLLQALPRLPAALHARHPVSATLEAQLNSLELHQR